MSVLHDFFHTQDFEGLVFENTNGFTTHKYIKDMSGNWLYGCQNLAKTVGLSKSDDLVGVNDHDLLSSQDAEGIIANDRKVILSRRPSVIVEQATITGGEKIIATSFKRSLVSKAGIIIGIIGMSIIQKFDISVKSQSNHFNLTEREMSCLYYLAMGYSIKQISNNLNLSNRTVEHYMENIKLKLNCRIRSELIAKALHIPQIRERVRQLLS